MYNARCPYKFKYELVEWAKKSLNLKTDPNRMSKAQLYAIWYKKRR
tara:strand:- start:523 stop:660 length:138 start_codon:yes stop_codon:yes gene_type:complete